MTSTILRLLLAVFSLVASQKGFALAQSTDVEELSYIELKEKSVANLERTLNSIDQRLSELPEYSLRSGVGAIGYRSKTHQTADNSEWLEIDLESEVPIDEVVLIPNILREETSGFTDDAFPDQLRVILGIVGEEGQEVVAQFAVAGSRPRIAPLVIPTLGKKASWIRVISDQLPQRNHDGRYIFQLAEIMVFSGHDNVAVHRKVSSSSNEPWDSPAWDMKFAVDGFVPYLMNGAKGKGNLPYVSAIGIGNDPSITIDLESKAFVSSINLHLVEQGDTVPQSFSGDFGFPHRLRIEGAKQQDFSDAVILSESVHESVFACGPIIMLRFSGTDCRYIRITASDPFRYEYVKEPGTRIGLAEIEVLAEGENVARHKPVTANFQNVGRNLMLLTDGNNRYGEILPIRKWLSELAERHELERKRPVVLAELTKRYKRQRRNLNWLIGLASLLLLIVFATGFVGWNQRQQAVQETREQIAADLHDELGANFHALGLISDLADASSSNPEKLRPLLYRMRELTERSGKAAAYCANLIESKGLYDNLIEDMKRTSARITADISHEFLIEGHEDLRLEPRKRIGLFLFHQECLINAIRHSRAGEIKSNLVISRNRIRLTVADNGTGLPNVDAGDVPKSLLPASLNRRAKLLAAKISGVQEECGGLRIDLLLSQRNRSLTAWLKKTFAFFLPNGQIVSAEENVHQ